MKSWKVIIEYKNQILEVRTEAKLYSEVYIKIGIKYPGCVVKSISEIRIK
jgi:hypothetical protein